MTTALQASVLVLGLGLFAVTGPWMLRHAAPALMRVPRLAVGLLAGSMLAWLLALLAVGPMLARFVTGPALLTGRSGEVCQRCLDAANPSSAAPMTATVIPVVALLALPAAGVAFLAVSAMVEARRRRRATISTARRLRAGGTLRRLHGNLVLVADDPRPFALTLPRRHGGIVISSGGIDRLSASETTAVLVHERAHLRQRHHLIASSVAVLTRRLRWVPLIAAASEGIGHYLEISADDAARRHVGTPALASALLTLGQGAAASHHGEVPSGALHAIGPDRVRHLVQPGSGAAGAVSTAVTSCFLAALAVLGFAVHVPYALAVLTGCA